MDPFAAISTQAQPDRFGFLHVDLNSFFASVEQQLHPEYRNKPLAVVPSFADTTVAIAASYEAKALGIKTGTRVADMKRICPDIIMVHGSHTTYAEYSAQDRRRGGTCLPRGAHAVHRRDGLPAHWP